MRLGRKLKPLIASCDRGSCGKSLTHRDRGRPSGGGWMAGQGRDGVVAPVRGRGPATAPDRPSRSPLCRTDRRPADLCRAVATTISEQCAAPLAPRPREEPAGRLGMVAGPAWEKARPRRSFCTDRAARLGRVLANGRNPAALNCGDCVAYAAARLSAERFSAVVIQRTAV